MSRFKITYTKEFSKIIYADDKHEAEMKFNRDPANDEKDLRFIEEEDKK